MDSTPVVTSYGEGISSILLYLENRTFGVTRIEDLLQDSQVFAEDLTSGQYHSSEQLDGDIAEIHSWAKVAEETLMFAPNLEEAYRVLQIVRMFRYVIRTLVARKTDADHERVITPGLHITAKKYEAELVQDIFGSEDRVKSSDLERELTDVVAGDRHLARRIICELTNWVRVDGESYRVFRKRAGNDTK